MQIPLQLQPRRDQRLRDFLPGPNQGVVEQLCELLQTPAAAALIVAPEGYGKTHLLAGLYRRLLGQGGSAVFLPLKRLLSGPAEALSGLESMQLVCVDDLHLLAANAAWEEALFHLFNQVRDNRGCLIMASRLPAGALNIDLPDLKSRLSWGTQLSLQPLSDVDKLTILQRQALAHGFQLPAAVSSYLLRHSRRSISDLLHKLQLVQQAAFARKRPVTVPLAREILQSQAED